MFLILVSAFSQVGIKTSNPKAALDIVGTTLGVKNGAALESWDNIWLNVTTRQATVNASSAEEGLQFNIGSNSNGTYGDNGQVLKTVATMTSAGNLGVGTTTPQNRIDLGSDAGASTSAAAGKKLAVYNNSIASSFYGLGVSSNTLQIHAGSANDGEPGMVLTNSGNVGIGAPAPNASATLELASTTKGFLPPRMTTAQRDAINPRVAGLTIYNTTLNCMQYWNTIDWKGRCTIVGNITTLNCAGATNTGTLTGGTAASGVSSAIPYTGGNGGTHSGQTVTSTGVTGLTAKLNAGTFANGNGTLTYTITGTPSGAGTASFAINIGGRTCTLTRTVVEGKPPAPGTSTDCTGWTVSQTGTSSGTVNGKSLTATVTTSGGAHTSQSNGTNCPTSPMISMNDFAFPNNTPAGSSSTVTIKFNKNVSNIKLRTNLMGIYLRYVVTIKRNGTIVSPTGTLVGTCGNSYHASSAQSVTILCAVTNLNSVSTYINIGGNWFDEIEIRGVVDQPIQNGNSAAHIAVCVGNVL